VSKLKVGQSENRSNKKGNPHAVVETRHALSQPSREILSSAQAVLGRSQIITKIIRV